MTKEEATQLSYEIEAVSKHFTVKPLSGNIRSLREDFDITSINTPKHYLKVIDEMEKVLRETRLLFVLSVFHRVCKEEGRLYHFDTPYQAAMKYDAVMKKNGEFFLRDEDGHFADLHSNENFARFIDDQYWEMYEQE